MILKEEVTKVYEDLIIEGQSLLFLSDSDITLRAFEDGAKFVLSTPVYFGANYLPPSVKEAITKKPPFEAYQTILTRIQVDEEQHRIYLHHVGTSTDLSHDKFQHIVGEFDYLGNEWRIYLDEHDKRDLIWVRK